MSSHIDFRTLPANVPVLCIPRVYPNISETRIRKIFDELNMGTLERVDIVSKTSEKGEKFNRVFVHFRRWNDTENANTARERLLNGKEIKIIYDEPWFWKISAYREVERKTETKPQHSVGSRKPTIVFETDEPRHRDFRTSEDRPREDRPREDRQCEYRPREYKPREDRPREYKPREYKPREDRPREDRPREYKPREYRPREYRPREERPIEERPIEDRPIEEQIVEDENKEETPLTEEVPSSIEFGDIAPPKKKKTFGKKSHMKELKIEPEEPEENTPKTEDVV